MREQSAKGLITTVLLGEINNLITIALVITGSRISQAFCIERGSVPEATIACQRQGKFLLSLFPLSSFSFPPPFLYFFFNFHLFFPLLKPLEKKGNVMSLCLSSPWK